MEWQHLYNNMSDFLAPTMAKDFPNLPVEKEEGCYYYGTDGKQYLDFSSGIAVTNVGHRHPKVVDAVKKGADELLHGPSGVIMYESILQYANDLAEVLPGNLDCFFFGNSGTEAVEGAIKLAKHVKERPYVISFTGGFHGRTMGALGVSTSKSKYRKFMQPNGLTYQLPYADVKGCPEGEDVGEYCVKQLEKDVENLFEHQVTPDEVSCMILEPILGEGGYIIPPKEWLQKVREICDEYGILLIFDEVQTGFGRTGEWFASQALGVEPDIMAIAKAMASGLPLGATVASKELMQQWPLGSHATTFGGNPLACRAAEATLEVLKEENLPQNAKEVGAYATERLHELKEKHESIGDIRSIGLLIGIEVVDPVTKQADGDGLMNILELALEKGALFYFCGNKTEVIRMIPPLSITKEQIEEGITKLDEALTLHEEGLKSSQV
ncbi:aspartate aminotransferase family protein [Pontibacillus yanchengensis]|uniref:4-aminobutyrate aminotransferase n=1 Tax=Pontibacillus yanchengensis Y32 TaxID=1385514 RepID=A0A0A2TRR7_9BACI|nr:aspartate aminotransferase family protein [Pontibacillus yanchengensis]KGP71950.1 4-aminobutyrate aminotransferase [Pontibacillus yanchengensis Y32]